MGNALITRKSAKLREKHFDINQASQDGQVGFTININTGEKIVGLKNPSIKTTQSGGMLNNVKFSFSGSVVTVTGVKGHSFAYRMVGEFTILY